MSDAPNQHEARRIPSMSNDPTGTPQVNRSNTNVASSARAANTISSLSPQPALQSSPSSHRVLASSNATVETALAAANGSYEVALGTLVTERNTLQNQNALLWKHVEKVKSTAASFKKDLDRIRGERDRALGLLEALRVGPDAKARPTNQRNLSVDAVNPAERPAAPVHRLSETGSTASLISIQESVPPSSTPAGPITNDLPSDLGTGVSTSVIPPTPTKRSQSTPSTPPQKSSPRSIGTAALPPDALSAEETPATTYPRRGSEPSIPTASLAPQTLRTAPPAPLAPSALSNNKGSLEMPARDKRQLSRESRISLPDEASHYITNMVDSPVLSPGPNTSAGYGHPSPAPPSGRPTGSVPPSPLRTVPEHTPATGPSNLNAQNDPAPIAPGFLDLENENESDTEDVDTTTQSSVMLANHSTPATVGPVTPQRPPRRRVGTDPSVRQGDPSLDIAALAKARESSDTLDIAGSRNSPASVSVPHLPTSSSTAAVSQSYSSSLYPSSNPSAAASSAELPRIEYKQARLTSDDLPSTTVVVEGSTIRPNDRGKEVLSFIIGVSVKGKGEPWKVEKLYSDVLTLDARVRSGAGKSLGKKLAPLPDSKLFKDNAPAKVDQRKIAVESYLQSLLAAPLKQKDDICMYFSTNVVRAERAPVHQMGHKEGYLTKRSKNFGGFLRWKTRYFVLQAGHLEYYESRGGQHLGSISIESAQIGRQQKPSSGTEEDENAFRHAFLIIESKRQQGSSPPRHVLCAESDTDRDSWVDALVRHVSEWHNSPENPHISTPSLKLNTTSHHAAHSSASSSLISPIDGRRHITKDQIVRASSIPPDGSPSSTITVTAGTAMQIPDANVARQIMGNQYPTSDNGVPLSSSLPSSLDVLSSVPASNSNLLGMTRAASEMGFYPDVGAPLSTDRPGEGRTSTSSSSAPGTLRIPQQRGSYMPSLPTVKSNLNPQETSPLEGPVASGSKGKTISGPINGTPIPLGYNFGGGNAAADSTISLSTAGGTGGPNAGGLAADRDRDRKTKSSHFWPFGGGSHKAAGGPPTVMPRAVFGVPIQEALAVGQIANLPCVVFRCIQYLETKHAEREEGIYRLSGSSAVIKALRDRFNTEGDVDLLSDEEYWDPHAIAGLLKSYFRELPTSILTQERHFRFLKVIDLADPEERTTELTSLISALPLPNYCLLRALTAHLINIVQNSSLNKMTSRNVGIVFSPTLGIPAGVFSLMLADYQHVFSVDDTDDSEVLKSEIGEHVLGEGEKTPRSREKRTSADVQQSRRNSVGYAEASADRLLGLGGRTLSVTDEGDSDLEMPPEESEGETDGSQSIAGSEDAMPDANGDPQSPPETPGRSHHLPNNDQSTPSQRNISHGAAVAATRGLQIHTERARSTHPSSSALRAGLPSSPRPNQQKHQQSAPPP